MTDRIIDWFEDAMRESWEYYIEDIKCESSCNEAYESRLEEELAEYGFETEEEYLEHLMETYDDPIEWYVDNFGAEDFGKACLVALGYKTWSDFR